MKRIICLVLLFFPSLLLSQDKLTMISPHRKSIQTEFIPAFKKYYEAKFKRTVAVDWIDQGGTENNLRFIINRFKKNPKSAQIDIFWGGGEVTFYDLEKRGLLQSVQLSKKLDKDLPRKLSSFSLRSDRDQWFASALSSFGIFYNKKVLNLLKMQEPKTWKDLYKPEYIDYVSVADPRQSSSSLMMSLIMLYSLGWDEGWKLLNALSANVRKFTHSSSDPIKAVLSGDAAIATAIDFYAVPKVNALGTKNLGFILPENATIFNSDPIALLKGAPNQEVAQRFVEYVLSAEAQKIFIYPKGSKGGPHKYDLGRIAVRPDVYQTDGKVEIGGVNPFKMNNMDFTLDLDKIVEEKKIISELIGTIHVDLHGLLRDTWELVLKSQSKEALDLFYKPLVTEAQMQSYLKNWKNTHFRSKLKNTWMLQAKNRYEEIQKLAQKHKV